jgi:hypothetical protein
MKKSNANVIKFPKLGRIPDSSINMLHQLAANWSLNEPEPLAVVFGVTDEGEDWCLFLDGLTDEPRHAFWKDGKSLHYVNNRAPIGSDDETRVINVPVTSASYLAKLIELIDPAYTKRKANE